MKQNICSFIKSVPLFLFLLSMTLPSCTHIQGSQASLEEEPLPVRTSAPPGQKDQEGVPPQAGIESEAASRHDEVPYKMLDSYHAAAQPASMALSEQLPFSKTKEVSVTADKMPVSDFIHYIFSDIFALNYVVDDKITGSKTSETVTLNLTTPVTEAQLYVLVKDILKQHKIMVYESEDIYYLGMDSGEKDIRIGIGASIRDIPDTTDEIQQVIPLRHTDVMNVYDFLPKTPGIKVTLSTRENVLIVNGARDQIEQVINTVNVLDRPAMRGQYVGMLDLTYWKPADMVKKLAEIMAQEGIPISRTAGQKGVYLTTLDRWGRIIVFAAEKEWLQRIRYWVNVLDVPQKQDEKQYFIFIPHNSKVSNLRRSLERILGYESPEEERNQRGGESETQETTSTPGKNTKLSETTSTVIGDIRIAVDENIGALIVHATPHQYKEIESLLKRLDIMPVQVLLEVTYAQVVLTDSLQYGVEWYLKNTDQDQVSIFQTMGGLGLGAEDGISGGLSWSLTTDTEKFQLLMNALAQESLIKILASPRITVIDGKSASMTVGTEVPIVTSEATTPDVQVGGTSSIIQSIQYRSTGISLTVTPSVQATGVVTLEISQEVSEAQSNVTSGIDSPIILERTIDTEVVMADGQTVLLGGLIQENESRGRNKVPILGDIPLLGHLFSTRSQSADRTELIIMITAHIIRSTQQMDEMREALFESFEYLGRGVED